MAAVSSSGGSLRCAPSSHQLPVIVVDNGAYELKAALITPAQQGGGGGGWGGVLSKGPIAIPNCIGASSSSSGGGGGGSRRGIIGGALNQLPQYHGLMLRRPLDRGFLVDPDVQATLWEHLIAELGVTDESGYRLLVTVPFGSHADEFAEAWHKLCCVHFHFAEVQFVSSAFLSLVGSCAIDEFSSGADREGAAAVDEDDCHADDADDKNSKRSKRRRTEEPPAAVATAATGGAEVADDDTSRKTKPTQRKPLVRRASSPSSSSSSLFAPTGIVVDAGFSGTTAVPFLDGCPVYDSICRVDVGGKVVTNKLKELISFSQVNVLEDVWLVNVIKERMCFVAIDFTAEMNDRIPQQKRRNSDSGSFFLTGRGHDDGSRRLRGTRRLWLDPEGYANSSNNHCSSIGFSGVGGEQLEHQSIAVRGRYPSAQYVLPTVPETAPLGFPMSEFAAKFPSGSSAPAPSRSELQLVTLRHERFAIPEALFTPRDVGVGVDQVGAGGVVAAALERKGELLPRAPLLQRACRRRVVLCGGCAAMQGFAQRFAKEVIAESPTAGGSSCGCGVSIVSPAPIVAAGAEMQESSSASKCSADKMRDFFANAASGSPDRSKARKSAFAGQKEDGGAAFGHPALLALVGGIAVAQRQLQQRHHNSNGASAKISGCAADVGDGKALLPRLAPSLMGSRVSVAGVQEALSLLV